MQKHTQKTRFPWLCFGLILFQGTDPVPGLQLAIIGCQAYRTALGVGSDDVMLRSYCFRLTYVCNHVCGPVDEKEEIEERVRSRTLGIAE